MRTERTAQQAYDDLAAAVDDLVDIMIIECLHRPWRWMVRAWYRLKAHLQETDQT